MRCGAEACSQPRWPRPSSHRGQWPWRIITAPSGEWTGPLRAGGARTGAPARVNLGSRSVAAVGSFLVTARFWAFWCYPSPSPAAALTSFGCRTPRPRAGTSGLCPWVLAGGAGEVGGHPVTSSGTYCVPGAVWVSGMGTGIQSSGRTPREGQLLGVLEGV